MKGIEDKDVRSDFKQRVGEMINIEAPRYHFESM